MSIDDIENFGHELSKGELIQELIETRELLDLAMSILERLASFEHMPTNCVLH